MITITSYEQLLDSMPFHCRAMLVDLKGLRERPDYHPEESAFEHVRIVTERILSLPESFEFKKELIGAALFHDIGKNVCAKPNPKLEAKFGFVPPTSPGHDKFGAQLAKLNSEWLRSTLGAEPTIVEYICAQHMRISQFGSMKKSKKEAFFNDKYFQELCVFHQADDMIAEFNEDTRYDVFNKCKSLLNENRNTEIRV